MARPRIPLLEINNRIICNDAAFPKKEDEERKAFTERHLKPKCLDSQLCFHKSISKCKSGLEIQENCSNCGIYIQKVTKKIKPLSVILVWKSCSASERFRFHNQCSS
jgi:hypothetical protein